MNSQHNLSKNSSGDLIADIKTQQANILEKMEAFKQAAGAKPLQRYAIRQLQQKYNNLVDQRARLERSPLSDLIEKLPPELWPDIIEPLLDVDYPVDVLLELTSVSRTWCNALISLPQLWTHIVLDDEKHDHLAKAVMGLYLSGSCEIDLFACLSMVSWQDALSFITAEAKRIRILSLNMPKLSDVEGIIAQLQDMPVLAELYLPGQKYKSLRDIHLDALGLRQMPSLRVLEGSYISIESELWGHLITSHEIFYKRLADSDALERCGKLPNLRSLKNFQFNLNLDPSLVTLNVSLPYIKEFTCQGLHFNRFLNGVGAGLTILSIGVEGFASLEELVSSLESFRCLHWLQISIANPSFTYNGTTATSLPSIRYLALLFEGYGRETDVGGWMIEESVDSLYEGFISIAPSVEVLELRGGMLTGAGMKYIAGLANLLQLVITESLFIPSNYPVSISSMSLQTLTVNKLIRAPELLEGIMAPALRELRIGGPSNRIASDSENSQHLDQKIGSPSFIISGDTVASIASLTIITDKRVCWEFYSLSALKELELTENRKSMVMVRASDALEAILMRPCDLPVLKKIKLTGQFFEWDILLLMLERRILYSHLGISHISTLVLPHHLPYKLLHPITALLQGKLPEREENDQFSLTATTRRLWDNKIPGCFSCCYAFRNCDSLTISGNWDTSFNGIATLALGYEGYELPSEYLTAYPPLSLEMAEWLSGKLVRRREFVRNTKYAAAKFYREDYYDHCPHNGAPVAITGHSLEGAYFENM